jgi:hypothetical protein
MGVNINSAGNTRYNGIWLRDCIFQWHTNQTFQTHTVQFLFPGNPSFTVSEDSIVYDTYILPSNSENLHLASEKLCLYHGIPKRSTFDKRTSRNIYFNK